jgi:leucyl/phenylalanyl-tRNA---protein transferase
MLQVLDRKIWFPPTEAADEDGLLAIGGDLSVERLLAAYQKGIFPWYNEDVPLWWSPDPRFVLLPQQLKVSKSMQQLLRQQKMQCSSNQCFRQVVQHCQQAKRKEQDGTWISPTVLEAYCQLHALGFAHSIECWQNGELVGGFYGVLLGKVFFGESMFSLVPNASKFALIDWVRHRAPKDLALIDCQVYTTHLESLGATMLPRTVFEQLLRDNIFE